DVNDAMGLKKKTVVVTSDPLALIAKKTEFDENNLFIFDDESVRISPVSKMTFRKKPHDSLIVHSKRCSKHMTGNRTLLTNFVEKFLGTVCFGNNDFAMIARYEDVVIGSMTIKKVYYVEDEASEVIISFIKKTQVNLQLQVQRVRTDNVPTTMVEQAKLKLHLVGKPVDHTDYRSMIGLLMYVTSSRSDIMFATYSGFDLTDYSDADHAGCHLDRKGDKLVCWSSKKQNCVSISTAESEYVAVAGCCAQVLWMRTLLTDYGFFYDKVPIYCDSKSAIAISCNPVQHTRTKHIDVRTGIDLPRSIPSHLGKLGL
nr:hypothetical protein [Tanacetum cinerariifolium]